jgi:hypothetical protein
MFDFYGPRLVIFMLLSICPCRKIISADLITGSRCARDDEEEHSIRLKNQNPKIQIIVFYFTD